jgi:hypothetical protein
LENKYNGLKDQMVKFTKQYEEDKAQRELVKVKSNTDEFKNFENRIKVLLGEERQVYGIYNT